MMDSKTTLNKRNKDQSQSTRPFVIAGYALIFVTFGVLGSWAATAKLDRAVVATGTIDVASNRKDIQHLEGGVISDVFVQEGQSVRSGDILVRLDPVQAQSNLQVLMSRKRIAQALQARLKAERRMANQFELPFPLQSDTASEVITAVEDQQEIFQDRAAILESQVSILESRIQQLLREKDGIFLQNNSFHERVSILEKQLERLRQGMKIGVVQSNLFSAREEEYIEVKSNIFRLETDAAKIDKNVAETRLQITQTKQQYKERASSEYKDVSGQLQELTEHIKVAQSVLSRVEIRAPAEGTVQNIKFHSKGEVLRPGEILMELVPVDEQMVINAQVSPIDVDSVHEGLIAEIKFPAFSNRFMPIIIGKVDSISKGSIIPTDGRAAPYFLARVNVKKEMVPDIVKDKLSAGMPADVIISAGERTVADYLISPLSDALRKSMRED